MTYHLSDEQEKYVYDTLEELWRLVPSVRVTPLYAAR